MGELMRLPGLVDIHTHLRVPGGEHKEDFDTGTAAALAGGFTTVLGMPNTTPPLITAGVLQAIRHLASTSIRCDVGLFAGASPEGLAELPALAGYATALKIYLNDTYGPLRVEDLPTLEACFQRWPRHKLIAMHAEGQSVAVGIGLAAAHRRAVHFCHISRRDEIELIAVAKAAGLPITCEVTPHHLFLTAEDARRLGSLGDMRPRLASQADQDALWAHVDSTVDCIATDHAPHTLEEKAAEMPPPGVAGLETALPLMLTAVSQGRLSLKRLIELMATNPRRIFGLPEQPDTYAEVDAETKYVISNDLLHTRCGWTPFAGMAVTGRVLRVVLRGQLAYDAERPTLQERVLAEAGRGMVLP